MTAQNVSVVVATYNRAHMLRSVIEPLLRDAATLEVVVVVDGSRDGSYGLLEELARTDGRVRPLWQENAGKAPSRAAGLAASRGEIVLFLDDDVIAHEDLVSGHASMHRAEQRAVVLGYMPPLLSSRRRPEEVTTYLYARDYEQVCAAYERDQRQVLLNLWAGNCSLRRSDATLVGLSGPGQLGYHADKQFGYRCLRAGLNGRFSRNLRATHLHQRPLGQWRSDLRDQVQARKWLADEYPDLDADAWIVRAPSGPILAAVRLLAWRPISRIVAGLMVAAIEAFGRAHLWPLQTFLARILRQVELVSVSAARSARLRRDQVRAASG